jgi:hypothetical protein
MIQVCYTFSVRECILGLVTGTLDVCLYLYFLWHIFIEEMYV